jgi:uncharacterized MAPEG superfamily protein
MTAITALLLFAAWTLLLMFTYVGYRVANMLGGMPANSWTRGSGTAVPGIFTRAEHAHTNCVENLPVFGAIVLAAYALGEAPVVDATAVYVLAARIAQSVTHIAGVSPALVIVRATFFTIQVVLMLSMSASLLA